MKRISDPAREFRADLVKAPPKLLEKLATIFRNLQVIGDPRETALALTVEVTQAIKEQSSTQPQAKPAKPAPKKLTLDTALNAALTDALNKPEEA